MLVLGIESSCDETAASVVRDGRIMLSNVIASQIDAHRKFGGIVPEIASRKHMEVIVPIIQQALADAGITLGEIEGIAVTRGPGLVGSLLVGLSMAKAMAFAMGVPFVGVNHLEGHIFSIFLTDRIPDFPFVALVVSGGHTHLYRVTGFRQFTVIGQTKDDAAGEAFDKAANLLNLGYPGGIVIDKLARKGSIDMRQFPRPMKNSLDFSFSGLKTSLLTIVKKRETPFEGNELANVAASYQEAIVDVLVEKTLRAARLSSVSSVVVCGGVASNSRLRERFSREAASCGIDVFIPPPILCTDNAAMIAVAGNHRLKEGACDPLSLNAVSRWPLDMLD